jgi:hypothetical protein
MFPAAAFLLSRPLMQFAEWVVLEILRTESLDLNGYIGVGVVIPYPGWLFFGSFGMLVSTQRLYHLARTPPLTPLCHRPHPRHPLPPPPPSTPPGNPLL